MTHPERDPFGPPVPPPSVWDQLGAPSPPAPPPPVGAPWAPSQTPAWQSQPWRDPSVPMPDPYRPAKPPVRRVGLVVALVVGAFSLSVVALGVLGAVVGEDGGSSSAPVAGDQPPARELVDGEPAYFLAEQGRAVTGSTPRGLALGAPVVVSESQRDADRLGVPRRSVRLVPSARLRQVLVAGAPSAAEPTSGRFLLVDVTTRPEAGAAVVSHNDFFLLLPDGSRARELSSDAGWYDLWPDARSAGWSAERTSTLLFDLGVGQDALLVYGDGRDGAVASWKVPGTAAPVVAPEDLPGYVGSD